MEFILIIWLGDFHGGPMSERVSSKDECIQIAKAADLLFPNSKPVWTCLPVKKLDPCLRKKSSNTWAPLQWRHLWT